MSFVTFFISLLFQLVLFSQNAQLVPTFSSQPSSPTVEEGQSLNIQWSYNLDGQAILVAQFTDTTAGTSGAPTVATKQAGDNNVTVSSGYEQHFNAAISDTQATLTILAAPRSFHKNKYQFRIVTASPNFFNLASDEVELSVLYAPYITYISNQTFNEGDPVTLNDRNCATDGNPPPNITWTRLSDNSVVRFPFNISRQDEGGYNCTADNGIGSPASGVAFITVHYKPENVRLVTNATANKVCQGDTLKFTCSADGKPVVHTYQLFENEVPLESDSSGMWIKTVSNNENLPNQTYKCVANNTVGTANSQNVSIFVGVPSSIQMIQNEIVTEGRDLNLSCNAPGTPSPLVSWIDSSGHRHNGNLLELTNINRNEAGEYRCEASNECGNSSEAVNITVHYPPVITNISPDLTVDQNATVSPDCSADGNPPANITWKKGGIVVAFPLNITSKQDEGRYHCTANNGIGNSDNKSVFVTVEKYHPFNTILTTNLSNNTVVVNTSFNLICSAQANPPAKYQLNRGQDVLHVTSTGGNVTVYTTSVGERIKRVNYACTSFNDYGYGPTDKRTVTVHYAPLVEPKRTEIEITKGDTARYECPVVGNPLPNVTWYEGNDISGSGLSSGNELKIENLQSNKSFTCLATNYLGTDTGSVHFGVGEKSITNETVSVIKITLTISNKNCKTFSEKEFVEKIKKLYESDGIKEVIVVDKRCGSVILDLELHFTKDASESKVITTLKDAAKNDRLGDFKVDPDSIKPTEKESSCKGLFKDEKCDVNVTHVVILVVCVVVVMACVLGGATYYWVHKRKKCRKDPRIHNSDDQEALNCNQSGADENAFSQVNGGYADSGPPSANGTDAGAQQPREGANGTDATGQQQLEQQVQGAPPTYAVVDKSTKKKKKEEEKKKKEEEKRKKEKEKKMKEEEKKNKNDPEQNIPQYAVVDKSQKKKKEVVEDAYAQVDMSKKSKKQKAKPGEMLYADLGDFQPRAMPAVSTSPAPLPPIKRPPAYEETQYADITQFMKGEATLPDANNSQGTEMTYANADGGNEKPKETANEGGKEEKPKETRM